MAGEYVWGVDTPTGVMKNSALSRDVRAAAIANTTFMPFVRVEPGYGRKMGESVTIQRIRNISEPTTGTFDERDAVPIDTFSMSSTSITVSYWGRGVQFTEFAELLSTFDLTDSIQRKLRDQMALVLDSGAATAFKTAKVCYIPTSVSAGTFDTDGTPSTTALENLTVQHVKVIRDAMMDSYHVPYYGGQNNYICLASTKALRGIKNDQSTNWVAC